jgi:hypothetical protein
VTENRTEPAARRIVSTAFSAIQDVVYVALGVLLAVTAAIMLVQELLYTVQVSFREHALVPEPFLLVALIAGVRRILVITAEFSAQSGVDAETFRHVMWELALLTVLIVVLVASLVILQRKASEKMARSHRE